MAWSYTLACNPSTHWWSQEGHGIESSLGYRELQANLRQGASLARRRPEQKRQKEKRRRRWESRVIVSDILCNFGE